MKKPPVPHSIKLTDAPSTIASTSNSQPTIGKSLTLDETIECLNKYLTPEHRGDPNIINFIRNYLICRSASQAAREIGLTDRQGINLKKRPDIQECITQITQRAVLKYGYDAEEVVERVKEIAQLDPIEFENADGTFKVSMKEISPETRRAIKKFKAKNIYEFDPNGIRTVTGVLIEVELWDKMKAVELLGREKDIFKETRKVQHDITANMSQTLLEAKKRAEEVAEFRDVSPPAVSNGMKLLEIIQEGDKSGTTQGTADGCSVHDNIPATSTTTGET